VEVARRYGRAKSRQDIAAALDCCTDDFVLEAPAFRTRSVGRVETEWDLGVFFELFPDYEFVCSGAASGEGAVVLWGWACMTWSGRLPAALGLPRGLRLRPARIELPAVSVFSIRDGLLTSERFHFDLSDFCAQLGLPAFVLRALLGAIERRRHAAVHGREAIRVEHSVVVRAPAEAIFARTLADVSALEHASPRWPWLRAEKFELVGKERMTTGAVRRIHLSNGHVTDERVEACEPPRRLRYRVENGWGMPIDAFVQATYGENVIEPLDGASLVTWRGFAEPRAAWASPVVRLLVGAIVQPMQRRFLAWTKRSLEAHAPQ
jgi:hypothetical protein